MLNAIEFVCALSQVSVSNLSRVRVSGVSDQVARMKAESSDARWLGIKAHMDVNSHGVFSVLSVDASYERPPPPQESTFAKLSNAFSSLFSSGTAVLLFNVAIALHFGFFTCNPKFYVLCLFIHSVYLFIFNTGEANQTATNTSATAEQTSNNNTTDVCFSYYQYMYSNFTLPL